VINDNAVQLVIILLLVSLAVLAKQLTLQRFNKRNK